MDSRIFSNPLPVILLQAERSGVVAGSSLLRSNDSPTARVCNSFAMRIIGNGHFNPRQSISFTVILSEVFRQRFLALKEIGGHPAK